MKTIEIQGKKYNLKTSKEEITLREYNLLLEVIREREYRKIVADIVIGDDMEEVPFEEESLDFKIEKSCKMINCLLNRPLKIELIKTYPDILNIFMSLIDFDNLLTFDKQEPKEIKILDKVYEYVDINYIKFQQWCDFENFIERGIEYIFLTFFKEKDKDYDRFFLDKLNKIEYLNNLPAKDLIPYINYILEDVKAVRERYFAIYDGDGGEGTSTNVGKHFQMFKWEDIIITIAETKIFDGQKGSLDAVRNANALEVLDYFNLKTHKNKAEFLDYQRSLKKK